MRIRTILSDLDSTRDAREALYRHFHRHPELSLQEYATADRIEQELRASGIEEVLRIGRTGVVESCATATARWSRCAATSTACRWPSAPAWTTRPKA